MLRRWGLRTPGFPGNSLARRAGSSLQNPVRTQALGDLQSQRLQDPFLLAHRTSNAAQRQFLPFGRLQLDVADRDLAQFAEDDLGRHRSGLRGGLASVPIRLVDLRLKARTFGQMVQRLPEGIRQHADHHVGLRSAAVVMPDRTEQQLALEDAEGPLHYGQLDVGLPELLGRPAPLIAPQQVSTIAGQRRPELLPKPDPAQLGRLALGHRDRHEWAGLGEAALQTTDALEDLVPVLEATLLDPFPEPL